MKRWLLSLFSYNRLPLLRNAVRSIERFFPVGDRMIVDDGSDEPGAKEFLDELRAKGWHVVVRDRAAGRTYGGYYRNMALALRTALERGYDRLVFFEDDHQLVWSKPDYVEWVESLFAACPDAIQIQPLFFRRIFHYADWAEYVAPARAYRINRGFNTAAVWNLDIVRKHPDYSFRSDYGDDLALNSAYWLSKGYRVYMDGEPTVAIMPWVPSRSVDGIDRLRRMKPSEPGGLLLKPLDEEQIRFLRSRPPTKLPYQEYFAFSRVNCERPVWHQEGLNLLRYFELCRLTVAAEDAFGASPAPVPVLERWAPTTIPPFDGHMRAEEAMKRWHAERNAFRFPWPAPLRRAVRQARGWLSMKTADTGGFDELRRRLAREQAALPYDLNAALNRISEETTKEGVASHG